MSGVRKESRNDSVAGSSTMMEPTMMEEGEEYFNTEEPSAEWTEPTACSQLCRMCATENEYLIPIFDGEGVEHQLGMKIEKHLPIRVHVDDTLPLQVCYQCASTLIAWHDLVVGCIEAEKKLRQLQHQGEPQEEDIEDVKTCDTAMFYEDPTGTEPANDPIDTEPSTSASTHVQIRLPPKKTVPKANPKLKMVIVKTPTPATVTAPTARMVTPKTEGALDTTERRSKLDSTSGTKFPRRPSAAGSQPIKHEPLDVDPLEDASYLEDAEEHAGLQAEDEAKTVLPDKPAAAASTSAGVKPGMRVYRNTRQGAPKIVSHIRCSRDAPADRIVYSCNACQTDFLFDDFSFHLNLRCPQLAQPHAVAEARAPMTLPMAISLVSTPARKGFYYHPPASPPPSGPANPSIDLSAGPAAPPRHRPWRSTTDIDALRARYPLVPSSTASALPVDHADYTLSHQPAVPDSPASAGRVQQVPPSTNGATTRRAPRAAPELFPLPADFQYSKNSTVQQIFKVPPVLHAAILGLPRPPLRPRPVVATQLLARAKRPRLKCAHCKATYSTPARFEAHAQKHEAHKCAVCDKYVALATPMSAHAKRWHEKKERKKQPPPPPRECLCAHCGLTFDRADKLKSHILRKHDPKCHECAHCDYKTSVKLQLHQHVMVHHDDDKPFVCEHCGHRCVNRSALNSHQQRHSDERPFACDLCSVTFKRKQLVAAHKVSSHQLEVAGVKSYRCAQCSKLYVSRAKFVDHANQHTGARPHQCPSCAMTFRSAHTLAQHKKRHRDALQPASQRLAQQPVPCPHCDLLLPTRQKLRDHRTAAHKTAELCPFACDLCGDRFHTHAGAVVHMRRKHFDVPAQRHKCPTCAKKFDNELDLAAHAAGECCARRRAPQVRHASTDDTTYKCIPCDTEFASKPVFASHRFLEHQVFETGLILCANCPNTFPSRAALREHRELCKAGSHGNDGDAERPMECGECGRVFPTTCKLRTHHRNKHTPWRHRAHACAECGKVFRGTTSLKQHMLVHIGKTVPCKFCDQMFHRAVDVRRHVWRAHPTEEASPKKPFRRSAAAQTH